MDTEKAKNAVIIMLIILNIAIKLLNDRRADNYVLSISQENAVTDLLDQNKIGFYTTFIKEFKPLKSMEMLPFDFSVLENLLFKDINPGDIYTSAEFDKVNKYSSAGWAALYSDRLEFYASHYEDRENMPPVTAEEARRICDDFLDELKLAGELNFTFFFLNSRYYDNSYTMVYIGDYNGTKIASNKVVFTIDSTGISQLECSLAVPGLFTGTAYEIYSADEALMELTRKIKGQYPEGAIRIMKMEIVYYLSEKTGGNSIAEPYYMFTVTIKGDIGGADKHEWYYINAYTNVLRRY